MHVFRLIVAVASRHWNYLAIYLGVLTTAAICMGMWSQGYSEVGDDRAFEDERPEVAVIDRDGSAISQALADFVEGRGTPVEVEDTPFGLQDASAKDLASYVLIIPEGFGADILAAAREGADAPVLETVVSYQSAQGALMDAQTGAWTDALYGFAATTDASPAQLVAWTEDACAETTPVAYAETEAGAGAEGIPYGYLVYAMFSGYAIFCASVIFISVGMAPAEQTELRRRLRAAPATSLSFSVQSGIACIVFGLAIWLFEAGVGIVAFSGSLAGVDPGLVATVVAAQLVYTVFAVSVGFLLWRLKVGEEYANALGNVLGMLFSFMGGAWMPLSLMSEEFKAVAHFTPGFWAMDAMQAAADSPAFTAEVAARAAGDLGIVLLFALAVLAVGAAAGRARLRERGA